MRQATLFVAAVAAVALAASAPAGAFILDDGATKDAQKWREDLQKQSNKFTDCVVKELLKCEKKSLRTSLQCDPSCDEDLNTGGNLNLGGTGSCVDPNHADFDKADVKFREGLAKCRSKFDPAKKAFDYDGDGDPGSLGDQTAIGCQGDCLGGIADATAGGGAGTQLSASECGGTDSGNVTAQWTTAAAGPTSVTRQVLALFDTQNLLACAPGGVVTPVTCQDPKGKIDNPALVGLTCVQQSPGAGEVLFSDCDNANGECIGGSEDELDCATDGGKILGKLTSKANKALLKCETDFKNKAGNGGPTDVMDDTTCGITFSGSTPTGGNPDLVEEVDSALADLGDVPGTGPFGGFAPLVPNVVNGLVGAADVAFNPELDIDGDGLGDGSPPVRGGLAPSCGSCGDGNIDFGEQCDPGNPGLDPPGCGTCFATTDFIASQTACQCSGL